MQDHEGIDLASVAGKAAELEKLHREYAGAAFYVDPRCNANSAWYPNSHSLIRAAYRRLVDRGVVRELKVHIQVRNVHEEPKAEAIRVPLYILSDRDGEFGVWG